MRNVSIVAEVIMSEDEHEPMSNLSSVTALNAAKASNPMPEVITRTKSTVNEYERKWKTISKLIGENPSDDEIYNVMLSLKEKLKPTSFRMYRLSASHILKRDGLHEIAARVSSIQSSNTEYYRSSPQFKRTSKKKKSISKAELEKVLNFIKGGRQSDTTQITEIFINAAIHTGLRPVEWLEAKIGHFEGYSILTVKNAKNTNGRSTGEFRHLRLENNEIISYCEKLIVRFSALNFKEATKLLNKIRSHVSSASQKALGFPNAKCATTFRHQFSADAKKLFSKEKVALMMGHNVVETAGSHYGKRKNAWSDSELKMTSINQQNDETVQEDLSDVHLKQKVGI